MALHIDQRLQAKQHRGKAISALTSRIKYKSSGNARLFCREREHFQHEMLFVSRFNWVPAAPKPLRAETAPSSCPEIWCAMWECDENIIRKLREAYCDLPNQIAAATDDAEKMRLSTEQQKIRHLLEHGYQTPLSIQLDEGRNSRVGDRPARINQRITSLRSSASISAPRRSRLRLVKRIQTTDDLLDSQAAKTKAPILKSSATRRSNRLEEGPAIAKLLAESNELAKRLATPISDDEKRSLIERRAAIRLLLERGYGVTLPKQVY